MDSILTPGFIASSRRQPLPPALRYAGNDPRPVATSLTRNDLLAALSRDDAERLFAHLDLVTLAADRELFDYGDKLDYAYFPTTAIVSLQFATRDGGSTEIAVIGHEGAVGLSLLTGERASYSAVVQGAGQAYRIPTSALRAACEWGNALPQLLLRYANALLVQVAQHAVSGRRCSIEQKLCRWLLERLDRTPGMALAVTQERIAIDLGVRRESVTAAAGKLQEAGLITYRRGHINAIDRPGLESYAGECYQATKLELDRLRCDVAQR